MKLKGIDMEQVTKKTTDNLFVSNGKFNSKDPINDIKVHSNQLKEHFPFINIQTHNQYKVIG
jgi:hypothetical protein